MKSGESKIGIIKKLGNHKTYFHRFVLKVILPFLRSLKSDVIVDRG